MVKIANSNLTGRISSIATQEKDVKFVLKNARLSGIFQVVGHFA